jgi:Co/Zn/Cd efflux system component
VKRLTVVLLLNVALITVLVTAGLAAGADYLADAGAIGVSLLAIWLAAQPGPPGRLSQRHQYRRAGQLRLAARAERADRRGRGPAPGRRARRVEGLPVLIVSGIAAVAMLVAALVLRGDPDGDDSGEDLNVKAVLLDTAADAAGVAVSGTVILGAGGWYWLDPRSPWRSR